MSKYLITAVHTYRVDTEAEVEREIEEAKANKAFTLSKYTSEYKETKDDSYYKLTLTKCFNNIKSPDSPVEIEYKSFYPSYMEEEDDEDKF